MNLAQSQIDESRAQYHDCAQTRSLFVTLTSPAGIAGILIAGLVFINEANFRNNDAEHFSVDWQILLRLSICFGCGLFALNHLATSWSTLERFPVAWTTLFIIWNTVTVPFSANLAYAAASSLTLWCAVLFLPLALKRLGPKRILLVVFGSLTAFAVGSYIVFYVWAPLGHTEFINPDGTIVTRLGGLCHANGLGRQMALMTMIGLFLGSKKLVSWRIMVPGVMFALLTMYFTNSRTSMLATAAAVFYLVIRTSVERGYFGKVIVYGGLGLATIVGVVISQTGFGTEEALASMSRSGTADEMYSFTGRTEIWGYACERIAETPIFGYGAGCSRFPMTQFEAIVITHAHNLLLNVTINTGIPGGILLVITLLAQIHAMIVRPSLFPDMLTVMVLVFGFADVPLFNALPDSTTTIWLIAVLWRPIFESQPAAEKPLLSAASFGRTYDFT